MISEADKKRLTVGYKQTARAVGEGKAARAYLAEDCEDKIKRPIEEMCALNDTELLYVSTMKELGAMCGIDVKASCAAVLRS